MKIFEETSKVLFLCESALRTLVLSHLRQYVWLRCQAEVFLSDSPIQGHT